MHRTAIALPALAFLVGIVAAIAVPLDGPTPPPWAKHKPPEIVRDVHCITADVGDGVIHHKEFSRPLKTHADHVAAARRFGQELQLQGALTGNEQLARGGAWIVGALALDESKPFQPPPIIQYGSICTCVPAYACGCLPGCGGQGCMHLRKPTTY